MRKYLYLLPILLLFCLWSSCRKDFEYGPSTGNLEFSMDTVYLDTLFTNIGSSTYTLKVYNRSDGDIQIPTLGLEKGQNSKYRLNVDGIAGKEFKDVPILAKDSMYIFIETTFDIAEVNENEFLYTDAIQFDAGANLQEVQLVTLVKDAVFLFPNPLPNGSKETLLLGLDEEGNEIRIQGFFLKEDQLNFTNQKPYVIYGYAAVPESKVLTMDAGTKVHFHKDSGILVGKDASLKINGELSPDPQLMENEVIFEGDRLEPEFTDVPGQWGAVWLAQGSVDNKIDHLTIKNATVGLLVEGDGILESPTLTIKNTQIYNSASVNLLAKTAAIVAENLVLGSAGNASLHCNLGGDYTFTHATIANHWRNGFRGGAALQIDNFSVLGSGETKAGDLTRASFTNCIIGGNSALELSLNSNNTNAFDHRFTNCLIKFQDNGDQYTNNPLYNFEDKNLYTAILLNMDPDFIDAPNNDFRIGEISAALGNAEPNTALLIPRDILGVDRTSSPDIGAYEMVPENQ